MHPKNAFLIDRARLVTCGGTTGNGCVLIRGGRIAGINPTTIPPGTLVVDAGGKRLTPGLIDLHTHGIGRWVYERGPDELLAAGPRLARYGTTTIVPTIVPDCSPAGLKRLRDLAACLPRIAGVCAPGLHLEGPFMALAGAACPTMPGHIKLLDALLDAGQGRVLAMSVSPETPRILPVIRRLRERGVAVFVTHTRATLRQAQAALGSGARHATHLFDVFPPPPEEEPGVRPPGTAELFLVDPRATVDLIADGCHVHPLLVQLAVRARGASGVSLVTDSNIGTGLPPGIYSTPWGYPVRVAPGRGARIADPHHASYGALAGSALTMNVGMANLLRWLDALPPAQVWAMGTANPARVLGLRRKGRLAVGADADLVLWNNDLTPSAVWVGGTPVPIDTCRPSGPASQSQAH